MTDPSRNEERWTRRQKSTCDRRCRPVRRASPPLRPVWSTRESAGSPAPREKRTHTVSGRETLWSIAESRLGSARRWHEIAELNYGVRQADGRALTESRWIEPGWVLALPEPARTQTHSEVHHEDASGREMRTDVTRSTEQEHPHQPERAAAGGPVNDHLAGFMVLPPDILTASPDVSARLGGACTREPLAGRGPPGHLRTVGRFPHRSGRDGAARSGGGGAAGANAEGAAAPPARRRTHPPPRTPSWPGSRAAFAWGRADAPSATWMEPSIGFLAHHRLSGHTPPWILGVQVHPTTVELLVSDLRPEAHDGAPAGPGAGRRSVVVPLDDLDADRSGAAEGPKAAAGITSDGRVPWPVADPDTGECRTGARTVPFSSTSRRSGRWAWSVNRLRARGWSVRWLWNWRPRGGPRSSTSYSSASAGRWNGSIGSPSPMTRWRCSIGSTADGLPAMSSCGSTDYPRSLEARAARWRGMRSHGGDRGSRRGSGGAP